jgi:hypothetical protein
LSRGPSNLRSGRGASRRSPREPEPSPSFFQSGRPPRSRSTRPSPRGGPERRKSPAPPRRSSRLSSRRPCPSRGCCRPRSPPKLLPPLRSPRGPS